MTATWTDVLLVVIMLLTIVGVFLGAVGFKRNAAPPGITSGQRKSLDYTRTLLGNYHAAHKASPLTGTEIEEVLRLCRAELDKVLEG